MTSTRTPLRYWARKARLALENDRLCFQFEGHRRDRRARWEHERDLHMERLGLRATEHRFYGQIRSPYNLRRGQESA